MTLEGDSDSREVAGGSYPVAGDRLDFEDENPQRSGHSDEGLYLHLDRRSLDALNRLAELHETTPSAVANTILLSVMQLWGVLSTPLSVATSHLAACEAQSEGTEVRRSSKLVTAVTLVATLLGIVAAALYIYLKG